MKTLPAKLKIFLIVTYLLTIFSIFYFIINKSMPINIQLSDINEILFFSFLLFLTQSFPVSFRGMIFSTSFAVIIACFMLRGPLFAVIVVLIGNTFSIDKNEDSYKHILNTPFYKTLFNYCVDVLLILYGNFVFLKFHGVCNITELSRYIIPLMAFCLASFFVNIALISMLFSLINRKSLKYNFIENINLVALSFLAMAPLGILAAKIFYPSNYGGLMLFVFPIILARFTFSQYIEAKTKYIQTVDVIMHAMEARDKYTEGHSKRVAEIACMIATELKYNEWKLEDLNIASLLHDVGKIGIDDHILNKPGKLTDEEYDIIKKHPEIGYKIISKIKDTDNIKFVVKYHHERYDGLGYPEGKKADDLNLDVFIVQLADSIDAMSTDRPYRKALSNDEIIDEVKKCRGSQFHPAVVDAYLRAIEKKNRI